MVWYTAQYTDANGAGAGAGDGDGDDIGRRWELLSLGQRLTARHPSTSML